jgi:PKD repeat protein
VTINQPDTAHYPYWIEMMQDPSINFFKVQSAFNKYWENRPITRGCGWKPFKRWEYMMQSRVSPTGERPSESRTVNAYREFYSNPANSPRSIYGNWTNLGPFTIPLGERGYKGLGRINAIAFHPTDPNTIYIGAPSGGLWVTHDGGLTWASNTDNLPTAGVSAIMLDYNNPEIIYMGTGDRDAGDAAGLGVMKSFDGGLTWSSSNNGMGDVTVGRLIIHPGNQDMLLAATTGGIFKTTDGGLNWTNKMSGNFKDIVFKTNDPSVIYASASGKFYRSMDTGESWNQITAGLTIGVRGVIGVTPANQDVVYFLLSNNSNEFQGLYKSTNNGISFIEKSHSPNIMDWSCDGSGTGGQAWYDLEIAVDPTNENIIYSGGVDTWKSTNSGVNWTINSHWYGGCNRPSVHADQHVFEYSPLNGKLYIGNDGGIYWTDNGGNAWNEITDGLAISQTYKLGQSATVDDLVINGYQDNGSSVYEGSTWTVANGGDGMECAVDPVDFHYRYSTLYYGDIFRHYNNTGQGKIAGLNTNGITESGGWVTPFLIDENDPKTMFIGYKNVWRSNNIKAPNVNNVTWTEISNGLTGDNLNVLEQSPKNTNILYVAGGNKLYRTDNCKSDAPVWINLSSKLPVSSTITDIEAHPYNEDIVYITFDNRVYMSWDKGNSWNDWTGLLPDVHISCIVYNKHSLYGTYIGTDMGVFYRDYAYCGWNSFSNGLPVNAKVTELEIFYDDANPANDRIKASTYGRGLWESEMFFSRPMTNFAADQTQIPVGCSVNFTDLSTGVPFTREWTFQGGNPSTSNQRNPTGITYETPGKYDVQLIVTNTDGSDTLLLSKYIQVSATLIPIADFEADKKAFCSFDQPTVKFTDKTTYCPNAWNWSFVPATVSFMNGTNAGSQNPDVKFNEPGNYTVTLIASNSNGSDTIARTGFINVGGTPLPFNEDFEHGFSNNNWDIVNPDETVTWNIASVGGTSPGDKAAWMNFYNYITAGKRDQMITPVLDFSGTDQVSMTFQHAYARRFNSSRDSLIIYITADCGNSWTRIFQASENGSGNFATHPLMTDEFFPTVTDDWCGGSFGSGCYTLDLSPWAGNKNIRLKFESYNYYGNDLYIDNIHIASDTTLGRTISGKIGYPKSTPLPLSNIHLNLKDINGTIVASSTTNESGNYGFSGIADGSYILTPATSKSWGGVSAADVLLFKKHIANISPLSGIFLASGDVNGSGTLTASDVLMIKKRIAFIVNSFDAGDWLFNNSPINVSGANVISNFDGLCYGDANASYTPPTNIPYVENPVKTTSGSIVLLPSKSLNGQTDISVYATDLMNMGSFQFTIRFDPAILTFAGISNWFPGIQDVTIGQPEKGKITFVWAAETSGISILNDRFFDLHFLHSGFDITNISIGDQPTSMEFATWDGDIFKPAVTNVTIDKATGIRGRESSNLTIYPNPGQGLINLEYRTAVSETIDLMVINGQGKKVFEENNIPVQGELFRKLDLKNLPKGPYLLKIQSGKTLHTKVLILQD